VQKSPEINFVCSHGTMLYNNTREIFKNVDVGYIYYYWEIFIIAPLAG
jgi:hypothetical protein